MAHYRDHADAALQAMQPQFSEPLGGAGPKETGSLTRSRYNERTTGLHRTVVMRNRPPSLHSLFLPDAVNGDRVPRETPDTWDLACVSPKDKKTVPLLQDAFEFVFEDFKALPDVFKIPAARENKL
ncbi:MAG: hypothetical protein WAU64_08315, partial [Methanoregula sp.]|uniref:hypothetical protein n=1 Tax=Methanoregula sp. TaxID=2052170 RepID=UPI003BAF4544